MRPHLLRTREHVCARVRTRGTLCAPARADAHTWLQLAWLRHAHRCGSDRYRGTSRRRECVASFELQRCVPGVCGRLIMRSPRRHRRRRAPSPPWTPRRAWQPAHARAVSTQAAQGAMPAGEHAPRWRCERRSCPPPPQPPAAPRGMRVSRRAQARQAHSACLARPLQHSPGRWRRAF